MGRRRSFSTLSIPHPSARGRGLNPPPSTTLHPSLNEDTPTTQFSREVARRPVQAPRSPSRATAPLLNPLHHLSFTPIHNTDHDRCLLGAPLLRGFPWRRVPPPLKEGGGLVSSTRESPACSVSQRHPPWVGSTGKGEWTGFRQFIPPVSPAGGRTPEKKKAPKDVPTRAPLLNGHSPLLHITRNTIIACHPTAIFSRVRATGRCAPCRLAPYCDLPRACPVPLGFLKGF